jgi:E3 ubiquitin-protein ligase HERC3
VAVGAGSTHTCAVLNNGSVGCWGSNGAMELGYPSPPGPGTPYVGASSGQLGDALRLVDLGGEIVPFDADLWGVTAPQRPCR